MTKTLTYSVFLIASAIVILGFVTAQTYSQLIVAAILYPALIFLAFKTFPRQGWQLPKIATHKHIPSKQRRVEIANTREATTLIADIDKRAFIKLIGATGLSFFLFTLLGRRADALLFGRGGQPFNNTAPDALGNNQFGLAGSAPTGGYRISEVDEGVTSYYGFINQNGAWMIMREEVNGGSFRYAKGDSSFPANWANRENLNYDYFHNLF